GLAANPNDLALMLNLLLPITIALFLASMTPSMRAFYLSTIVITVIGVVVTFSRAGFLGLIVIGTAYVLKVTRRRGGDRAWAAAALVAVALTVPLLPSKYIDRISTVTNIESDPTGSSQIRWRDTVAAVLYVMEHTIIGAG